MPNVSYEEASSRARERESLRGKGLSPFRLGGLTGDHKPYKGTFSFFVSVCFTLNYVMGSGFLSLPWGFAQAGALLGVICLCFVALLANIAKDYVLETSVRAELLDSYRGSDPDDDTGDAIMANQRLLTVRHRKYEMPTLCEMFLSNLGKRIYMVCLSIYIWGALLAYSTVFSKSCAAVFPLWGWDESTNYTVYLVLFAVIVWPLSCLELTEQVSIQVVLSACRILMVVMMVGSIAAAYHSDSLVFPNQQGAVGVPLVNFTGLFKFLPIACYAFIYHHSIAGLSHPVRDKKHLGSIFLCTFVVCTIAYAIVGVTVASFFGPHIEESANIGWNGYEGPQIISLYILLFPALDVASAFPLNAITLGNNMLSIWRQEGSDFQDDMDDDSNGTINGDGNGSLSSLDRQQEPKRATKIVFRLLAAVPPVIIAFFLRELGQITDYAGVVGIVITLIFPSILHLRSRYMMKQVFQVESAKVSYSNTLSRKLFTPFVLIIGVALFLYIFINLLIESVKKAQAASA